ncbi:nucleotidyltransferase family protein [Paracoccaceae bacterium GXU_MW_L88]
MTVAGLLLAAGRSERFGPDNKLLAELAGRPLIAHAAGALRWTPLDMRIAVISDRALHPFLKGFIVIEMVEGSLQADSLKAGVHLAQKLKAEKLLVTLGDMPLVTADLLYEIILRADGGIAAASDGTRPMPPACFPEAVFPELMTMSGDRGAGALLKDLPSAQRVAAPRMLADVDRESDLQDPDLKIF